MGMVMVHITVPAESRADISAHVLWKQVTTTMFNVQIVNLDVSSYLHITPKKTLTKAVK